MFVDVIYDWVIGVYWFKVWDGVRKFNGVERDKVLLDFIIW